MIYNLGNPENHLILDHFVGALAARFNTEIENFQRILLKWIQFKAHRIVFRKPQIGSSVIGFIEG